VLISRGRWHEAERQLDVALRCLTAGAPALGFEGAIRLAFLRCRQGRLDEAGELCAGPLAAHPLARLCLIEVALDSGDLDRAADLVGRYLRALAPANRLLRAPVLELAVRVACASGDLPEACEALAALEPIVTAAGTGPLRASLRFCSGLVAARRDDLVAARADLADAADLWARDGARYEAALTRRELGIVLLGLGNPAAAVREWQAAHQEFTTLGAARAAASVQGLLCAETGAAPLSGREVEILRLVADGLNDREIGARLTISPHTVHRHVANIRTKLGQPSRAAAVAHAARINLI
jgi:DNA-binding CsgD family transcriptional regulator